MTVIEGERMIVKENPPEKVTIKEGASLLAHLLDVDLDSAVTGEVLTILGTNPIRIGSSDIATDAEVAAAVLVETNRAIAAENSIDLLAVHKAGTETITGAKLFTTTQTINPALDASALILKGSASQAADLLSVRNSSNTVLASIGATGIAAFAAGSLVGGQAIVVTNDVRLADARTPAGAAGGVLSGTYPNPGFAAAPSFAGLVTITAPNASTVALVTKAAASQSANIWEARDSTNVVLASIGSDGTNRGPSFRAVTTGLTYLATNFDTSGLGVVLQNDAHKGLVIRRNSATATGSLLELQDELGGVSSQFGPLGRFGFGIAPTSPVHIRTAANNSVPQIRMGDGTLDAQLIVGTTPNFQIGTASNHATTFFTNNITRMQIASDGRVGIGNSGLTATQLAITPNAVGSVGVAVKALASQTANLIEAQDSAGTVKLRVSSSGDLIAGGAAYQVAGVNTSRLFVGGGTASFAQAEIDTGIASGIGLIIKGFTSQAADLFDFQDSAGTVLGGVTASAGIYTGNRLTAGNAGSSALATFFVKSLSSSEVGTIIRGSASQSADLLQIQDSAGTGLIKISSAGGIDMSGGGDILLGNNKAIYSNTGNIRYNVPTGSRHDFQVSNAQALKVSDAIAGSVQMNALTANSVGALVKGAASQTADLFQAQNSAGSVKASIASDGTVFTAGGYSLAQGAAFFNSSVVGDQFFWTGTGGKIRTATASSIPLIVQGAASQSGDLLQMQNSAGTVVLDVLSSGALSGGNGMGRLFDPSAVLGNAFNYFVSVAAGSVPLVLRGAASQTADIQQWQLNGGTVVGAFDANGRFVVQGAGSNFLATTTLYSKSASEINTVIKAAASQSSDLVQLRDSANTVLSGFGPTGKLGLGSGSGSQMLSINPLASSTIGLSIAGTTSQTADLVRYTDAFGDVLRRVTASGQIQSYGVTHTFDNLAVPTGVAAGAPTAGGAFAAGTYYWVVTATNAAGETVKSAEVTATPALNQQVTISWTQVTGATGYKVYRSTVSGTYTTPALLVTITNGTTTTYTDTGTAVGVGAPPTAPTGTKFAMKGWSGQAGNLFELQDSGGVVSAAMTLFGQAAFGASTMVGRLTAHSVSSGVIGLVVRGAASQSVNLFEAQDSSGSMMFAVNQNGVLKGSSGALLRPNFDTGAWGITTQADSVKGLVIRANSATQSASLLELQDYSGANLARFSSVGDLYLSTIRAMGSGFDLVTNSNGSIRTFLNGTGQFSIVSGGATAQPFFIKGAASQSGDLLQVQDSNANILSKFGPGGRLAIAPNTGLTSGTVYGASAYIEPAGTGVFGILVKGVASQASDLIQVQDSSGAVLSAFDNAGWLRLGSGVGVASTAAGKAQLRPNQDTGGFLLTTANDANKGLAVRRNSATQSANLTEWQNESGTALSSIASSGLALFSQMFVQASLGSTTAGIVSASTSWPVFVVKGLASQSADLFQAQSSAAAVLAKIDSGGGLYGSTVQTNGQLITMVEENGGGRLNITKMSSQAVSPTANHVKMYVRDGTTAGTLKIVAIGPGGVETLIVDNIA